MTDRVYVLESGEYEQRGIDGIYDSAERAMGAVPGEWTRMLWLSTLFGPWHYYERWEHADRDHVVTEMCVKAEGDMHPHDHVKYQRYVSGLAWAYDEITDYQADALLKDWRALSAPSEPTEKEKD